MLDKFFVLGAGVDVEFGVFFLGDGGKKGFADLWGDIYANAVNGFGDIFYGFVAVDTFYFCQVGIYGIYRPAL